VFFIKTACRIQRVMKLVSGNTGVAGTVKVLHKFIDQIEKIVFERIIVLAVKPIDQVAAVQLIVQYDLFVTCASRPKLVLRQ